MNESTPPPGSEPPPPPPGSTPPPPPSPAAGAAAPPPKAPVTVQAYPVDVQIAFPAGELNRKTTFFRIALVIPIALILAFVSGGYYRLGLDSNTVIVLGGGLLVLPTALMIIFREKYPRWWFDFNVQLLAFVNRVATYLLLMTDRYPSTDEEQNVKLTIDYPVVSSDLNRFMPLFKWLLAIPHYIALGILGIGIFAATVYAWFAILITGRYPEDIFDFVVGYIRWHNRVVAYAFVLSTDRYPPFRFSP